MKTNIYIFKFLLFVILLFGLINTSCQKDTSPLTVTEKILLDKPGTIDINNDGIADYKFYYSTLQTMDEPTSSRTKQLIISPFNGNKLLYKKNVGYIPVPYGFLIKDSIDVNYLWIGYSGAITSHNWQINKGWDELWKGNWAGVSHQYLPIALQIKNRIHYGWIEMSVDQNTGKFKIHDYSYNQIAGEGIEAGEKIP